MLDVAEMRKLKWMIGTGMGRIRNGVVRRRTCIIEASNKM